MGALGMGDEMEMRLWSREFDKSRPPMAVGGPDRLLRTLHFYYGDDEHDLVQMVAEKYRDDIEMFGYAFPANRTIVPWGEQGR